VNLSRPTAAALLRRSRAGQHGQGMVEFAIIVPVFLLLLMGMLEFGFVFTHNLTLEYATREGARAGSALSNGGSDATPAFCDSIDQDIINAVTKVLKSPGSPILGYPDAVSAINIWQADASGDPIAGTVNVWTNKGDGSLTFTPPGSPVWKPCTRDAIPPSDSIGVSLTYTYTMITPLSGIEKFFGPAGPATLQMTDKTVMSLNPTN
jgi:Flp pilus assembly protein TadG